MDVPGEACVDYGALNWTEQRRQEIVDIHNEIRDFVASGKEKRGKTGPQPPAANMWKMQWDEELHRIAQRWADQCQTKYRVQHDTCRKTERFDCGQFSAGVLSTSKDFPGFKKFITEAYNQIDKVSEENVKRFSSRNEKLESIGSYLQLVWFNTAYFGCGYSYFKDSMVKGYVHQLICNYGPKGGLVNQAVYQIGEPCSGCQKCDTQFPNLCTDPNAKFDDSKELYFHFYKGIPKIIGQSIDKKGEESEQTTEKQIVTKNDEASQSITKKLTVNKKVTKKVEEAKTKKLRTNKKGEASESKTRKLRVNKTVENGKRKSKARTVISEHKKEQKVDTSHMIESQSKKNKSGTNQITIDESRLRGDQIEARYKKNGEERNLKKGKEKKHRYGISGNMKRGAEVGSKDEVTTDDEEMTNDDEEITTDDEEMTTDDDEITTDDEEKTTEDAEEPMHSTTRAPNTDSIDYYMDPDTLKVLPKSNEAVDNSDSLNSSDPVPSEVQETIHQGGPHVKFQNDTREHCFDFNAQCIEKENMNDVIIAEVDREIEKKMGNQKRVMKDGDACFCLYSSSGGNNNVEDVICSVFILFIVMIVNLQIISI